MCFLRDRGFLSLKQQAKESEQGEKNIVLCNIIFSFKRFLLDRFGYSFHSPFNIIALLIDPSQRFQLVV